VTLGDQRRVPHRLVRERVAAGVAPGRYQIPRSDQRRPFGLFRFDVVARGKQEAAGDVVDLGVFKRKERYRMSEGENLFGREHVERYRETDGAVGHIWKRGAKTLLLTTKGRKTGKETTTPLIYERAGNDYVIVASKGGAPKHPGWYRNLAKDPEVEVQVKDVIFPARARTAEGDERERLWKLVTRQWPDYDAYQTRTEREIPVVVLERG
jgi:deazaflavin-dependent oxidoreductase (nitroreductase family)